MFNGKLITNNKEYIDYLIYYYNYYSNIYELDANILIAQAYVESGLKCWNYAPYNSTATGISQFLIGTLYEVAIANSYNIYPKFEIDEINILTLNITNPHSASSYVVGAGKVLNQNNELFEQYSIARKNRYNILVNSMNNPYLLIKAQFRYMKYIANRNKLIASNTLFAYNRGSSYRGDNYYDIVSKVKSIKGGDYIVEGVNYVERIFGILGDKENINIKNKPKYYYFGYDLDLNKSSFDEVNINT